MTVLIAVFLKGAVDLSGFNKISHFANETRKAMEEKKYKKASRLWGTTENIVLQVSNNVDFYNVLKRIPTESERNEQQEEADELDLIMNGKVKTKLNFTETFEERDLDVFMALFEDFMLPVTHLGK